MADKKRAGKYTEKRDGGIWTKPSQKGAKSYQLTNDKDLEDWLNVAGTPQEGAFSQRFTQNAGTNKGNLEGNSTVAKIQTGVSTNTDSKDIKDPNKKEAVQKAEKEGLKQSQQTSAATSAYDAATETPSSEVKDSKTALKNAQKVANDINEGKVDTTNMSREEIEKLGTDAAKNPEDLTQPQGAGTQETAEPNDVEKAEADAIGYKIGTTPSPETTEAAETIVDGMSDEDKKKAAENKYGLGTWEKLAIALTALSFGAAALTGGEILPVNLIGLTGVDQRLAAMHKANAELDKYKKLRAEYDKAVEGGLDMSFKDWTAEVGVSSRNVTEQGGAETNQSEQEVKLLQLQQDYDLKKSDVDYLHQLGLIDKQGELDINKLKIQATAAAEQGRLNREQQMALAKLNNASNEEIANKAMIGGIASTLLGALVPGNSDENKKKVRHTYIPKEKRGY